MKMIPKGDDPTLAVISIAKLDLAKGYSDTKPIQAEVLPRSQILRFDGSMLSYVGDVSGFMNIYVLDDQKQPSLTFDDNGDDASSNSLVLSEAAFMDMERLMAATNSGEIDLVAKMLRGEDGKLRSESVRLSIPIASW